MKSCKQKQRDCRNVFPKHYRHPQDNPMYAHGCAPCNKHCEDVREGVFEFDGPAILVGVCNIHKSYLVLRDIDGDCDVRAGAIFPGSRTRYLPMAVSMEFSLPGHYRVKYKWDACCENEPQFEAVAHPCQCA